MENKKVAFECLVKDISFFWCFMGPETKSTINLFCCFLVGDRLGQYHSGQEVYSSSVRVFDTGLYSLRIYHISVVIVYW